MPGPFSKRRNSKIQELTGYYEKKIFDLTQLIEISKSLNTNLDYNNLVQSILYICMGQLKVLKAGLFARKDIDHQHLYLHRSLVGFEIDHDVEYIIAEDHPVLRYFQENFRSHSFAELKTGCPEVASLQALVSIDPFLIVPLRSKSAINGILVLSEPIKGSKVSEEDREYVLNIAHLAGIAVHNAFLYEITTTDMMTKLKLRHFLVDALQDQMARARHEDFPLSMMMIDIDHFKNLNDTYGHLCGDAVIRQVAQSILESSRQTDVAARYGGEEFLLLLPESDIAAAEVIAERIRSGIANRVFEYEGKTMTLTVSIGVAQYIPSLDTGTHGFIERSDAAMYTSKRSGRNLVSIAPENTPEATHIA